MIARTEARLWCPQCKQSCKSSWCEHCLEKRQQFSWEIAERVIWDGEAVLYSEAVQEYFRDEGELTDYLGEHEADIDLTEVSRKLRVYWCRPCYATEIDPYEEYEDLEPEGATSGNWLPDALVQAFDDLNKEIREGKFILSWESINIAAEINGHA